MAASERQAGSLHYEINAETAFMSEPQAGRSQRWVWWICGLLLLASSINYMDRQTLSSTSPQIKREFVLTNEQYGTIEFAFGMAFAVGASVFGFVSDRTNVRWLYPGVLLLWSAMGFATGLVQTYSGLLLCRFLLGFFEAGHWPCALKTTQRLLPPKFRTLGNSVLQSGTAIGAIVTPQIIKVMVTDERGSWRIAFQVVGAIGVAEISRVEDVHISLVDDLASLRGTLLAGLEKKSSQLSVWSKASGKKMRLGLSAAVDFMWMPRSLTFLDSTCSASELKESYFHACGGSRRTRSSQFEGSL